MLSLETYYTERAIEQTINQNYLLLARVVDYDPDNGREKEQTPKHRYPEDRRVHYKYSIEQVRLIDDLRIQGKSWRVIAEQSGVPVSNIYAMWSRNRHRLDEGGCV